MSSACLVHISDLHFGAHDAAAVDALREAILIIKPKVVLATGDFTQKARPDEFALAVDFLESLDRPVVITPGNHDLPGWNIAARLVSGFARYRRLADRFPSKWENEDFVVETLSTPRRLLRHFDWSGGRVNVAELERAAQRLDAVEDGRLKIVGAHHPLVRHRGDVPWRRAGRSDRAMRRLREAGAHIVMGGHDHQFRFALNGDEREGVTAYVQAPTGVSHRLRGEGNGYAAVTVNGEDVRIEHVALENNGGTRIRSAKSFLIKPNGLIGKSLS